MQHSKHKSRKWLFFLVLAVVIFFAGFALLRGNKDINLKKSNSHINILLMGRGGGAHDGPDLTDTVIFTSVDEDKNRVAMVSIPRDLWVPELQAKINTAYAFGQEKQDGGGITLARAAVSKIVGEPIDYVFVIDFSGFVKAVDEIGGLDITVDRAFDDYEYPLEDKKEELCGHTLEEATELIASLSATEVFPCRYTHLHFNAGKQHMDGETALQYVRSRYAQGPEGSDFARSRRQQKVIQAFKNKVFSLGILLNPLKVASLYGLLKDSIDTNIDSSEIDDFVKLALKMKEAKVNSVVLQTEQPNGTPGLLIHPSEEETGGQWTLSPRAGVGVYSEIQSYVDCITKSNVCPIPKE